MAGTEAGLQVALANFAAVDDDVVRVSAVDTDGSERKFIEVHMRLRCSGVFFR